MWLRINIYTLFLLVGSARAFVFPCEEVKHKLINQAVEFPTLEVCLIPVQEFDDFAQLFKTMFVRSGDLTISFAHLYKNCFDRTSEDPWRIVGEWPTDLNCDSSNQFTLIFTSSPAYINRVVDSWVIGAHSTVLEHGREVQQFVQPTTGVWIGKSRCTGSGNVTVFTGVGIGEEEQRFVMKSWKCEDFPDRIFAFDNAITIAVDPGMTLEVDFNTNDNDPNTALSRPDVKIAVMSSGRSDNLPLENTSRNIVRFHAGNAWKGDTFVTASCDPCFFENGGFLHLVADDAVAVRSVENFYNISRSTFAFNSSFEVDYEAVQVAPENLWDSQDNFVLELWFGDSAPQLTTEPAEATEVPNPTTQKSTVEAGSYCGCELDSKFGMPVGWDSNYIWIDLVILLDTSEAMGEVSLIDASTLIESFIGTDDGDVLITDTNAKLYTRIGLIAMSDKAEVIFNLNMTKSDKVIDRVHIKKGVSQINVVDAFNAALVMFDDGLTSDPSRVNTRQVIYYMTDSDPKIDMSPLNQFKTSYGIIIVNNFLEADDIERPGLQKLASDGYYHSDIQDNYMETIQLFCKANCFCKPDSERSPYGGLNPDPAVKAAGGCFHAAPVGVQFSKAKSNCVNLGGGLITSVHDPTKAEFLHQLMVKAAPKSEYFWIGYSKSGEGWDWEDQSTDPYTNWDFQHGEPSPAAVAKCAYVDMMTPELNWGAGNCNVGFPSVCEFAPCSVGNDYC